MLLKIREASEFIASIIPSPPRIGMITGTGLGDHGSPASL
jgi:purine nucleoside phosphorylase